MAKEFRVVPADRVPTDAAIGHFDQLDETAQSALAAAVRDRTLPTVVSPETGSLEAYDLVKFTEYFRIETVVAGEAGDGSIVASD